MFLTYGFEPPSPAIMKAWNEWFAAAGPHIRAKGHFPRGHEIDAQGARDLPMDTSAITGFLTIEAGSFDEAKQIAATNPFITAIRIYELMPG